MPAFLSQYWPLLGLGLVLAVTLLSAWRFNERIKAPLADLLKSVERLSSGDWGTRVEQPVGRVGRALGSALERLRINLADHAATGRALDIMLDSMNDAVFVTSPDGLIKRVNLAATQMLGWSQMQLLGREISFLIADQDRAGFNIEQATNEMLELTMRTQAGQTIPVSLSGSVLSAEDPRFQGCIFAHAHVDHNANANLFAGSTWLARPAERAFMWQEGNTRVNRTFFEKIRTSKSISLDRDEYDVFGDGTVVLKAAPGHSPGHQVLVLNLATTGRVMIAGDLYHYPQERTLKRPPPDTEFNVEQSASSRVMIEEYLKKTKTEIWIEHDFVHNATLRKSPQYYE